MRSRTFGFLNFCFYWGAAQGFLCLSLFWEEFQITVDLGDPSRRTNSSCCLEQLAIDICFKDFHLWEFFILRDCTVLTILQIIWDNLSEVAV